MSILGKQCDMPGLYMEPTIFCDVEDTMWIAKEESFGPVMIGKEKGDFKWDFTIINFNYVYFPFSFQICKG